MAQKLVKMVQIFKKKILFKNDKNVEKLISKIVFLIFDHLWPFCMQMAQKWSKMVKIFEKFFFLKNA